MGDFGRMRASDAERFAIVARLQEAAAEGRLSLGEFSYRASRAYDARTWYELDRLVDDIPPKFAALPAAPVPAVARPMATLPLVTLGFGMLSIPGALLGSVGLLIGPVGMLVGVLALYREPENRGVTLSGTLLSLLATLLFVILPVVFGVLPG
jgi:hypothetical protein